MKKIANAASPPPPPVQDLPDSVGPEDLGESVPLPQFRKPRLRITGQHGRCAQQSAATPVNPAALHAGQSRRVLKRSDKFERRRTGCAPTAQHQRSVHARARHHRDQRRRGWPRRRHLPRAARPPRRSRKMLVMEDGHPVNLALWLDPSVHYFGAAERFESVEVIRGTTITHGPNNNFGTINARNLSPFGASETVLVSSSIGFTKNKTGSFLENDDDEFGLRFVRTIPTSRPSGTRIHARRRATSASCCQTPKMCKAPGILSACAATISTVQPDGRARIKI